MPSWKESSVSRRELSQRLLARDFLFEPFAAPERFADFFVFEAFAAFVFFAVFGALGRFVYFG